MQSLYSALQVHVTEYKESSLDSSVVLYVIEVSSRNNRWTLDKRYSQFDELQKNLKKTFHGVPNLPGKSFFKIKESAQLQGRRKGLQEFIKLIVVRKDIISSQTFRAFLQLDEHAQEVILNPPTLAGQFDIDVPSKESRGVRAFSIDRESFTFFIATGQMSILNKFNAAITNSKVFSKEQTSFKVAGSVDCYIKKEETKTYQKTWSRNYPIQAICLEWSVGNECLIVGLDDGTVQILKTSSQNNFLSYQLKVSSKVHTARVMGVQYDPFSNSVFSVSEDCQFKICEDEHLFKIWGYNHKVSLTGIQYDYVNKRAIIVTAKGDFFVYDINDRKSPKQLANLNAQSKGCIRGLCVDFSSNYAFTGGFDDGQICVFFIDKPGRQKYTSLNAVYKGKDKVRAIGWSNDRHQIMVGSANGTVTFWNPNKAETLYVQKCHDTQITQLKYLQSEKLMVTSSKGKQIKFWRLPLEWRSKEVEDQEIKDADIFRKANMAKYVVDAVTNKDNDSDDDDLAGWHKD